MRVLNNRKEVLEHRRALRKNATMAEKKLWANLRQEKAGAKFRRQHSISRFVADFYCAELKLVIEVDGASHETDDVKLYDAWREGKLKGYGITVIRFTDDEVHGQITSVLLRITDTIAALRQESLERVCERIRPSELPPVRGGWGSR